MWMAVFLLTALTLVSVSVNSEAQAGAVTPVYLDTPGEGTKPAAQVHRAGDGAVVILCAYLRSAIYQIVTLVLLI